MSFARINPGNWASLDSFTASQANQLDIDHSNALDIRSGQTNTLSSITTFGGAGRFIQVAASGADANTNYSPDVASLVHVSSSVTANRTYTLNAGATTQANDRIAIYCDTTFTHEIGVVDSAANALLFTLGNDSSSDGTWAEFRYDGTNWARMTNPGARLRAQYISANTTFTPPPGVTELMLIGCGGGGGGGGGAAPGTAANTYGTGGGGGGGAVLCTVVTPCLASVGIPVVIGPGGASGASGLSSNGGNGGDGQPTTFSPPSFTAISLAGGAGGCGGVNAAQYSFVWGGPCVGPLSNALISTSGGNGAVPGTASTVYAKSLQQGGPGVAASSLFYNQARTGMASPQGFTGGAGGSEGGFSGTYIGGGGGGGGGAGPGGNGAAGGTGSPGVNGGSSGVGGAGSSAAGASGAGGGGGGASGAGSVSGNTSGPGGVGGSGFLYVCWVK